MNGYRYELKFTINKNMAEILKQKLKIVMDLDSHCSEEGYLIRSLYFDDYNSTAYYEKIDGVLYRRKYRIRIYDFEEKTIKLECKEKKDNYSKKRATTITKQMCYNLINREFERIDTNDELVNEFINEAKLRPLLPSIMVDYKRVAFTYPVSDVRVTFDSEISSGYNNFDIFDKSANSLAMINDNEMVLEVKFNEVLPNHIALVLSSVPIIRQAFSKFAVCRSMKE